MKKTILAVLLAAGLGTAAIAVAAPGGDRGPRPAMDIEKIDLNGDGNISLDEINAERAERFAGGDSDGSGTLTFEEFSAFAEDQRAEREATRMERRFASLDANDDGIVTAEEHAAHHQERMERRFNRVDTNNDGLISPEEREAAQSMRGERRMKRHGGQ